MTGKERTARFLARKKPDRIALYEHFWKDTVDSWKAQGHIAEEETIHGHFGFDMEQCGCFNLQADFRMEPETIEETAETILRRDGNGAVLRFHKLHASTPEHVDFLVKDYATWNEYAKPRLTPDAGRIRSGDYAFVKERCDKAGRFFFWTGPQVFELMRAVCGHVNMLEGMLLEPEWITEMAATYVDLTIALCETLFAEHGKPDGMWFPEDMGFKERPFMSPAMYREFLFPAHKKFIDFSHAMGLKVVMHCCGFIEPLLPHIVETGLDALQAIEIKSGMDLLRIYRQYGDRLSFMGGLDVRVLESGDRAAIDRELEAKIPIVKQGFGYALHSDHSIPDSVSYDTYRYFIEKGLALGKYD
jgi:uroporphyrinogen decarboxylase